jgi:peptidyl-tRNA hydrolase
MKLYVVVREDLSPGSQMAQSLHAFREFVEYHPEIEKEWYKTSNTIVILGCKNESELVQLRLDAIARNIKFSIFKEPYLEDSITSIAFEPGLKTSEFLSSLKLAGQFTGKG